MDIKNPALGRVLRRLTEVGANDEFSLAAFRPADADEHAANIVALQLATELVDIIGQSSPSYYQRIGLRNSALRPGDVPCAFRSR